MFIRKQVTLLRGDKVSFEKKIRERINVFLSGQKLHETVREPAALELVISRDGEITPTVTGGYVFDKTLKELIEELKKMLEEWK